MVNFWRHSVYCGVVAQLLADRCHVLHSERLFVAGLLHDIGKLIISHRLPEETREILQRVQSEERPDYEIEQELLGFDHADVGGELLRTWQMPVTLANAVQYHHQPQNAEEAPIDVALTHIANAMTVMAEQGQEIEGIAQTIKPQAWTTVGLDDSVMDEIYRDAGSLFTEALESILPRSFRPY
jgi:putative nucleotidyltransferase with HDIG domain